MMSKTHIAAYHSHRFAAAAATIVSPLPSPAMTLNDTNPWADIVVPAPSASAALSAPVVGALVKDLSAPSVVYSTSIQPTISFDGSCQPKNVINDVFLSSTMLYDDVEFYLDDSSLSPSSSSSSSSSTFDSDSDSVFSTPSQHDDEHPMTPMSPFMENDSEDQLYDAGECVETIDACEQQEHLEDNTVCEDVIVDMKRPMFIPVSICDARDMAAMTSLPTPPECNARKHSYDFLDSFVLTKRRRVLSVDMVSAGPASPPASNAGDDDAESSDVDSSANSFMAHRRSPLQQMRHIRHLTPTSPSMAEIVCFAPPTLGDEYDCHPELDHSDDEDDEDDHRADEGKNVTSAEVPSGLFVVEAGQETIHNVYLSEDNESSSDDEADFGYSCETQMQIDAMSSSDDSDSDVSEVEDYVPVRRRGTWHGPSREEVEKRVAARRKTKASEAKTAQASQAVPTPRAAAQQQQPSQVLAAVATAESESEMDEAMSTASAKGATSGSETRSGRAPTLFQILTKANIDWCRYCGTTEGVNWRPGPWGKRTLCNKHGCDFKGYGFACKLPRLDLTSYAHETVDQRIRPVLQHFCHGCQSQESMAGNVMVRCEGCPKAFHQRCHGENVIPESIALSDKPWFCDEACKENVKKRRVCVELPKKRLPLMSTPKPATPSMMATSTSTSSSSAVTIMMNPLAAAGSATEKSRSRGSNMRASISGDLTATTATAPTTIRSK